MAAKSSLRVGMKVSFGDKNFPTCTGTIKKLNPKTARITCPGKGTFDVSYNLIKSKSRKTSARKAGPVARKTKGKRALSAAAKKRKAFERKLASDWEKQGDYLGRDAWSRGMYSNPAKRKRNSKGQFVKTSRRRVARRRR